MKLAIFALAISGCTSMVSQQMTPEQITAMAKDKNAGVVCAHIPTPAGVADITIVNVDKGVVQAGSVTCGKDVVTMSPAAKAAP